MNNDVLALLEMMLTFGQMMLCLTAQMKKSKPIGLDFLAAELGFEPRQTESESVVLTVTIFGNVFWNSNYSNRKNSICQEKKTDFFHLFKKFAKTVEMGRFLC